MGASLLSVWWHELSFYLRSLPECHKDRMMFMSRFVSINGKRPTNSSPSLPPRKIVRPRSSQSNSHSSSLREEEKMNHARSLWKNRLALRDGPRSVSVSLRHRRGIGGASSVMFFSWRVRSGKKLSEGNGRCFVLSLSSRDFPKRARQRARVSEIARLALPHRATSVSSYNHGPPEPLATARDIRDNRSFLANRRHFHRGFGE